MQKISFNDIADSETPFENLDLFIEKICRMKSISSDDAKHSIADSYGFTSWYQFVCQLTATIAQRKAGKHLFSTLKTIKKCIFASRFDMTKLSECSRYLLGINQQDCINFPTHFQNHLLDLNTSDEWFEYLDGSDIDIHFNIKYWSDYCNFRAQNSLSQQLHEFVRYKIENKMSLSTGDLIDRETAMHMYARCHPDGTALTLSEFWCQKGEITNLPNWKKTLSDRENFVSQTFHVIETVVLNLSPDLNSKDLQLEFTFIDAEKFYNEVFLKSKLGKLQHKKHVASFKSHTFLTILISF